MSRGAYEQFRQALEDDAQLASKLRERVAEAGEGKTVETTVEFARRHGFDVDPMDVRRA